MSLIISSGSAYALHMQLVNSIHFICKPATSRRALTGWSDSGEDDWTGLIAVDADRALYVCGNWAISDQTALSLLGGLIFLHRTKDTPAHKGLRVIDFKVVFDPYVGQERRIEFLVQIRYIHPNTKWPKGHFSRAWRSPVVPVIDNIESIPANNRNTGLKFIKTCSREEFSELQKSGLAQYWPHSIERHLTPTNADVDVLNQSDIRDSAQ